MKDYAVLAQDHVKVDSLEKVMGTAKFAADYKMPNMLYGGVFRSTVPHAYIKKLNLEKARAMPGVACALDYTAIPGKNRFGIIFKDEPCLVDDKVRRYGDAIAVVAAETPDMKAPPFVMYSCLAVGYAANALGGGGGPLAVFFVTVAAVFLGKLVSKRTPVDIIVTPAVTIILGVVVALIIAPPIGSVATLLGQLIMKATELQPFLMGVAVATLMGIILTLPISSAAICAAFGLVGLAGGACVAGCCAQMVGLAVCTYRENRIGGLLSQGLGTSMLQVPNLLRKPILWLPPVIASMINGPIATVVFKLQMNGAPISSGMTMTGKRER